MAPAMTEHWRPRFGDRQMLVGKLGPAWRCLVGWVDAGPRSKLPRSGDLMDGDRRAGEKAGGRVRRQTWPDQTQAHSGRGGQ